MAEKRKQLSWKWDFRCPILRAPWVNQQGTDKQVGAWTISLWTKSEEGWNSSKRSSGWIWLSWMTVSHTDHQLVWWGAGYWQRHGQEVVWWDNRHWLWLGKEHKLTRRALTFLNDAEKGRFHVLLYPYENTLLTQSKGGCCRFPKHCGHCGVDWVCNNIVSPLNRSVLSCIKWCSMLPLQLLMAEM